MAHGPLFATPDPERGTGISLRRCGSVASQTSSHLLGCLLSRLRGRRESSGLYSPLCTQCFSHSGFCRIPQRLYLGLPGLFFECECVSCRSAWHLRQRAGALTLPLAALRWQFRTQARERCFVCAPVTCRAPVVRQGCTADVG